MRINLKLPNVEDSICFSRNILIGCIGFTLPFSPRLNTLFIALSFMLWLFTKGVKLKAHDFRVIPIPFWFLFCFYLAGVISLLYTESANLMSSYHSFVETRLSLIILPLMFLTYKSGKDLMLYFYFFALGVFIFCLILNLDIISSILVNREPWYYFFTKYIRHNMLENSRLSIHTMYLSVMLLVVVAINTYFTLYILDTKNFVGKAILWLATFYFLIILYLVGARISIVTIIALCLLYFFYTILKLVVQNSIMRFFSGILLVALISSLVYENKEVLVEHVEQAVNLEELHWESPPNRIVKFLKQGDDTREVIWRSAVEVFMKNFWFGVGGDSTDEMQKFRPRDSWAYINGANAHNQYLETAVQLGAVGLFFWLAFYFGLLHYGLKHRNPLLIIYLLIIGIALITESMLQEHRGLVFISFFAPLLTAYKPNTDSL